MAFETIKTKIFQDFLPLHSTDLGRSPNRHKLTFLQAINPDTYRPLIAVRSHHAEPTSESLSFKVEFDQYASQKFSPDYAHLLETQAKFAVDKIKTLGKPNVWVVMPTRKEQHTSEAVESIIKDCGQEINPIFFIFHNFTTEPTTETIEDLAKLKDLPNTILIEMKIGKDEVIGNTRGFAADLAMMTARIMNENDPIIANTDADIRRFRHSGIYAAVLKQFQSQKKGRLVDAVTIDERPDLQLLLEDRTIFYKTLILEAMSRAQSKNTSYKIVTGGRRTFIRGSVLSALDGFLPVSLGEDLGLGHGIDWLRDSSKTVVNMSDKAVIFDDRKRVYIGNGNTADYYDHWVDNTESPKPPVPNNPQVDVKMLIDYTLEQYRGILEFGKRHFNGEHNSTLIANLNQMFVDIYKRILSPLIDGNSFNEKELEELIEIFCWGNTNNNRISRRIVEEVILKMTAYSKS